MAVSKQEVIFEFNTETGGVDKTLVDLGKKLDRLADAIEIMSEEFSNAARAAEEVTEAAEEAAVATEDIGKEAKKSGGFLKKAGKLGADGFKLVGTAIAATGLLGLVTKVLMPIIDAFLENKKVADTLRVAMAGIGAVIDTIIDLTGPLVDRLFEAFSNPKQAVIDLKNAIKENIETRIEGLLELFPRLGEAIKAAFSGNFAEAGKIAADAMGQVVLGVENVTDKVADAVDAVVEYKDEFIATVTEQVQSATALERAMIALDDRQRDLNVRTAEATAAVEELKRQRDDERLSIEERIAAAELAAEIDQERADEQVAIAEERARLLRQEIELQGETEERLDALAEAQIAAADARATSAGVQTELTTSLISLDNERVAQLQEIADAEKERVDNIIERQTEIDLILATAQKREEAALLQWYQEQKRLARENGQILVGLEEAYEKQKSEIRDKYNAEELAEEQAITDAKFQLASNSLAALQALTTAFASKDEANAERQFKIQKALSLASATVSSTEGVINAYKTAQGSPYTLINPAYPAIQAGLAAAFGVAQIATIARSKYQSPAQPSAEGAASGTSIARSVRDTNIQVPTLDLGFLGAGAGQDQPVRAYVLAENVSNAQQANQKIKDQTLIG
jgi:hypothetical protein